MQKCCIGSIDSRREGWLREGVIALYNINFTEQYFFISWGNQPQSSFSIGIHGNGEFVKGQLSGVLFARGQFNIVGKLPSLAFQKNLAFESGTMISGP